MSVGEEIVERFYGVKPPYIESQIEKFVDVEELVKSIDAAAVKSRQEALEEACKAVCPMCRRGETLLEFDCGSTWWQHKVSCIGVSLSMWCHANDIRELMAKEVPNGH